ncbi:hypothetical protein BDV96DRAFT_560251 [Lophiotrema nucula]|uniref:Fungal N-terminal domain-containing protein n=1 Tax=Lophiotrema nucula TaxID=690887 RepID=A0A6A5YGT8_9PLEO|nr:hypothetical protein BDV96DRAFT_560251 [Lophiotrema nucula]
MAEALAVVATIASIGSLVDILARTIAIIDSLASQWQESNLMVLNLNTQMRTLKSAVVEIKDWMETNTGEIHHQLILDLDSSLSCCQLLASRLDRDLSSLGDQPGGRLPLAAKAKFVVKNNSLAEIQRMVDSQIAALTLLLTACNSKTLAAQSRVLVMPASRKKLDALKQYSASLVVLRDEESFISRSTENSSKLSMIFEFDGELFSSRVYRNPIIFSLRNRRKRRSVDSKSTPEPDVRKQQISRPVMAENSLGWNMDIGRETSSPTIKAGLEGIVESESMRLVTRTYFPAGLENTAKTTFLNRLPSPLTPPSPLSGRRIIEKDSTGLSNPAETAVSRGKFSFGQDH